MFTMIVAGLAFAFTTLVLGAALLDGVVMPLLSKEWYQRKEIEKIISRKETDWRKVGIFFVIWFVCGAYLFG